MLWTIAALILLFAGLFAIKRGAWPARVGETPHCRRCDYIVAGLPGDSLARCPECGLPLTAPNVVRGERRRERGRIVRGGAMLAVGLGLIGMAVFEPLNAVNWYKFKPSGWVIDDLASATPALRDDAWRELNERRAANRLSQAEEAKLDAMVVRLYLKGSPGWPAGGLDYLMGRFGVLTADQQAAVVQHLLTALTSNIYTDSKDAGARLRQLESAGLLSPAHHAKMADTALAVQAAGKEPSGLDWLMEYLGRREAADLLTPDQRERFLTACFNASLDVRPLVVAGAGVPYRVRLAGRGPSTGWWSRVALLSRQVDDGPTTREGGSMGSSSFGRGSSIGGTLKFDKPGRHELKLTIEMAAAAGVSPTEPEKTAPRWTRRLTLARPFDVLPAGAPEPWSWIDDPSLAAGITKSIVLSNVRASDQRFNALSMTVQVANLPANVAFDVLARTADGKEHRIGSVTAFAGTRHHIGVNAETFPPGKRVGKVDVIFRSSEALLKGTTDMYEAWRGEVVFRDVAVTPEKN